MREREIFGPESMAELRLTLIYILSSVLLLAGAFSIGLVEFKDGVGATQHVVIAYHSEIAEGRTEFRGVSGRVLHFSTGDFDPGVTVGEGGVGEYEVRTPQVSEVQIVMFEGGKVLKCVPQRVDSANLYVKCAPGVYK